MTTTIASRVVEFLRTNGASSIQLMSDSLGVPSNRISATISQINAGKSKESARIIGDRVEGKPYSIYSLDSYDAPRAEKKQDVCVAMPGVPEKSQRDIERRVSACVNACAGMTNEQIDNVCMISGSLLNRFGEQMAYLGQVEKQRDELLAALERSLESFEYIAKYGNSCGHSQLRIPDLKAVIASVKGGAA